MSILYLVATPIGDPDDLSPRAARCLAEVDLIAAEDTRVARTLLGRLGLRKQLVSYHAHNEEGRTKQLLDALSQGQSVALIPDQGTPLVSDPGYRLVSAATERGLRVVPIPGPSAALAALVVCGFPVDRFTVVGFLPRRGARRRSTLEELAPLLGALVLFEAPHRVAEMIRDSASVLGPRPALVARNLTKPDEELLRGTLPELADRLGAAGRIYGELTVVIAAPEARPPVVGHDELDRAIARLLAEGLSPRVIRDVLSDLTGIARGEIYRRAIDARRDTDAEVDPEVDPEGDGEVDPEG